MVKKSKAWEIKEDLIFYLLWLLIDYKAKVSQQASYRIGIFRGKAELNMKNNNYSCESSKITVNIFGKILKKNIPNSERTNLFNLPDITPEEFIKVMDMMLKRMIKNRQSAQKHL